MAAPIPPMFWSLKKGLEDIKIRVNKLEEQGLYLINEMDRLANKGEEENIDGKAS